MISAEDLGGLLFSIHHHEDKRDPRNARIIYYEEDIIKLLKKLGFPEPVWGGGKFLNLDDYEGGDGK